MDEPSSSSKVNMSLDDIIRMDHIRVPKRINNQNPNNKRMNGFTNNMNKNRNRNYNNFRYNRNQRFNNNNYKNNRSFRNNNNDNRNNRYNFPKPHQINNNNHKYRTTKLFISNLAPTVNTEDLYELFSTYGNLTHAFLHHDQYGVNLGTGEVEFECREDAIAARNKLNGVPLDSKPLNIVILNDNNDDNELLNFKSSVSRRSTNNRQRFNNNNNNANNNDNNRKKENVSAEDLDRELDEWRMKSAAMKNNQTSIDEDNCEMMDQ